MKHNGAERTNKWFVRTQRNSGTTTIYGVFRLSSEQCSHKEYSGFGSVSDNKKSEAIVRTDINQNRGGYEVAELRKDDCRSKTSVHFFFEKCFWISVVRSGQREEKSEKRPIDF